MASTARQSAKEQCCSCFLHAGAVVSGTHGYASYRIPAIIQAPKSDLLAFCEGQVNGSNDFGNIQIVMKRSRDAGASWSDLRVVANNDTLQAGNGVLGYCAGA